MKLFVVVLIAAAYSFIGSAPVWALDNGVARKPPLGWSTWNSFGCNINEQLIRDSAKIMADSPLRKAGYEYILLDDCWSACDEYQSNGHCLKTPPRDQEGRIPPDPQKFPSGMRNLTDYVHSLGLKIGIYTAVSSFTCAQYLSSLGHEAIDVDTFVNQWNMDFIKHDTCNTDCGIHDGCMQNSTKAMSDAIVATGKDVVYYIDSGNPTSPMRVFNPHLHHVIDKEMLVKVAVKPSELAWVWAPSRAHMFKSWFDIGDKWHDTLTNAHNSIRTEYYQSCGAYNMPDMLTVGMGKQSLSQYRAQFYLWAIMASPLILGNDIRQMNADIIELLTNEEVLAVDQDEDCNQGSRVSAIGATEVWIKTLHDQTFAAVLLNKDEKATLNVTLYIDQASPGVSVWGDFYPIGDDEDPNMRQTMSVRDIGTHQDLGTFRNTISLEVGPMDARMITMKFVPNTPDSIVGPSSDSSNLVAIA